MPTPYNTGKVLIGRACVPRAPQNDHYMDQIQSALCPPGKTAIDYRRAEAISAIKEAVAIIAGFAAFFAFCYITFPSKA